LWALSRVVDILAQRDPLAQLVAGALLALLAPVHQAPLVQLGAGVPLVQPVAGAPPAQAAMQVQLVQLVQLAQLATAMLAPPALQAWALLVLPALLGAGAPLALLGPGAM